MCDMTEKDLGTTIMVKSSWDDSDWIMNSHLLFYLKLTLTVSRLAMMPPPPESMFLPVAYYAQLIFQHWFGGGGRGGWGEGKLVSSQNFSPWLEVAVSCHPRWSVAPACLVTGIKPGSGHVPTHPFPEASPGPNLTLSQTLGTWPSTEQGPTVSQVIVTCHVFANHIREITMIWQCACEGFACLFERIRLHSTNKCMQWTVTTAITIKPRDPTWKQHTNLWMQSREMSVQPPLWTVVDPDTISAFNRIFVVKIVTKVMFSMEIGDVYH